MALIKKFSAQTADSTEGKSTAVVAREAEAQRKKARTLAKQQQAAERVAAATGQLASGIAEASSAAEELKRASDQIAAGAEEASTAAQQSLAAFQQVGVSIAKQLQNADAGRSKGEACQLLIVRTSADVAKLIANVAVAAQRQLTSVQMVSELERQAATIGDIVKAVARIPGSRKSWKMSSGFTSTLPNTRWCCPWMNRARSKRWTPHSPACR